MQPETEWPGAGGAATGPGVSKRVPGHSTNIATAPTGQRLPVLIAQHIGRDYLTALAAGGAL